MGDAATAELFDLLRDTREDIGKLTGILERVEKDHTDHEKRIKDLELKDARRGGILATIAIVASALGSAFGWIFKSIFAGGS